MNWRQWLWTTLTTAPTVTALVPAESILAAGSLEGRVVARPFVVVRLGSNFAEFNEADRPDVTSQEASLWVHDEPGSYKRIDMILEEIRDVITGPVSTAIAAVWQGDSPELSDPDQGTIVRNCSFRLLGRV